MQMQNPSPSIESIGLAKYLDQTKDEHNGYTYADFEKFVEVVGYGKTSIGRAFNVNRHTIYKWLDVYHKERSVK